MLKTTCTWLAIVIPSPELLDTTVIGHRYECYEDVTTIPAVPVQDYYIRTKQEKADEKKRIDEMKRRGLG